MATETKKANGEVTRAMNPPAAIHNAMGMERKPFTYTPGGLDLSEIKSERMARRLMRNAMSPGVQETSPAVQSPTGPPPAFPQATHYNNLPVQVFPAFQLPANPKLLLRTRSTPQQPRECSSERTPPPYSYAPPQADPREGLLTNLPPVPRRSSAELSPLATANLGLGRPPQVYTPPMTPHAPTTPLQHIWSNGTEDIDRATPSIVLEPCLKMPSEILQCTIPVALLTPIERDSSVMSNTEDKRVKSKKKTPNDDEVEVEATVKITKPKKTISTSVEIERKILPDGTVEETKTTTTNTIINGKVEDSKVQKEKRILSPEEAKAVIEEESEEEEEEEEEEENIQTNSKTAVQQNGIKEVKISESKTETKKTVITTETKDETKTVSKPESKETITTIETKVETNGKKPEEVKKTVVREVSQSEEEEEEDEEDEEEEIVEKKIAVKETKPEPPKEEVKPVKDESEVEEELEEEEEEEVEVVEEKKQTVQANGTSRGKEDEDEAEPEEEEEEIAEEVDSKEKEQEHEVADAVPAEKIEIELTKSEPEPEVPAEQPKIITIDKPIAQEKENLQIKTEKSETKTETITSTPVPEVHTTSKTESTEISTSVSENAYGRPVSTQTELHRVENIVTVNKTVKSLDNSYEQMTQQGIPTVRTYFAPPTREKLSSSPIPSKPYTPNFTSERKPERRHSLLLDRLSTERQVAPPESYHNTYQSNQSYESVTSNQYSQEPQSEVLNVSNVKPSSISNSQWYQTPQPQNAIYNNVQPATPNAQQWQQPSYTDNLPYESPRPTNTYQTPETPSYAPKPSSWGSSNLGNLDRLPSINAQSNQYSFMSNKNTTESYTQQSTETPQYSSGYIPPPWESEKSGDYQETTPQYYQGPSSAPAYNPNATPGWKPAPQQPNYSKPNPVSYQPPAPNASFVKPVTPDPKQTPGRKTYYSEYERRYISVPESTYYPTETKVQPQWDASPQYYYDNPEPTEEVEQPWRKELREFTEKTVQIEEKTVVQPPWKDDTNYTKNTSATYTPQPTWSQTLRPRSYREQSFDSESLQYQNTQEWPKSNTLNRRPVSAFMKTRLDSPSLERTRGVSVDRYNANSYQPPAPYTPAPNNGYSLPWENQEQVQMSSPAPQQYSDAPKAPSGPPSQQQYHNPQVPAYHARAPTEPREYHYQPRWSGQGRERPVQSRSFKYLQMLTGTEDGVEVQEPFVAQQPHHSAPRPRRV